MGSFRNPKYVERYEYSSFDLETPLVSTVANATHQKKTGYRFVVDNSGEVSPFDWYNAYLEVNFVVNKLSDAAAIAIGDEIGIVNGSHSLIKDLTVKANGVQLYDCHDRNQAVNVNNLLDYGRNFVKGVGITQLFYTETSRVATDDDDAAKLANKGFSQRTHNFFITLFL